MAGIVRVGAISGRDTEPGLRCASERAWSRVARADARDRQSPTRSCCTALSASPVTSTMTSSPASSTVSPARDDEPVAAHHRHHRGVAWELEIGQ